MVTREENRGCSWGREGTLTRSAALDQGVLHRLEAVHKGVNPDIGWGLFCDAPDGTPCALYHDRIGPV
jgi:hypothetical protein